MKKNKKKSISTALLYKSILIISIFIFIIFLISLSFGCSAFNDVGNNTSVITESDELTSNNLSEESNISSEENITAEDSEQVEENEQAEGNDQLTEEDQLVNSDEQLTIKVYYTDEQAEYLVGETRVVTAGNKYGDALIELMKVPLDESLLRLVPETTLINEVSVENGLAKVDLSDNFLEDGFHSDTGDILLIYSIVNTLTEFSEVNSVTFYINGEKLDDLGTLDISDPLFRRNDLIK